MILRNELLKTQIECNKQIKINDATEFPPIQLVANQTS